MTIRVAHLADPHLGFRAYGRLTDQGRNQREVDVTTAFRRAITGVIAARPDLVVVAGDLFHAVRPTNAAILEAYREFARLREALPGVPVVLIAGNHDSPKTTDVGSPLMLFAELGVDVAVGPAQWFRYPDIGVAVYAVPHPALISPDRPAFRPEGQEPHQVLVLHGEVEGYFPTDRSTAEPGGAMLAPAELAGHGWSYVAIGHYHRQVEIAPRVWYSGAPEYVSSNVWGEARQDQADGIAKGWLLVDLDTGSVDRRPVDLVRRIHDLTPLDGTDCTAEDLDACVAEALESVPGGIDGHVVRLVIEGVPRSVSRAVDHAAIRRFKARALHLQVEFRPPTMIAGTILGSASRRLTLEEQTAEHLRRYPIPADIDRDAFVQTGLALLAEPGGG